MEEYMANGLDITTMGTQVSKQNTKMESFMEDQGAISQIDQS